jgi:hypothetical protein
MRAPRSLALALCVVLLALLACNTHAPPPEPEPAPKAKPTASHAPEPEPDDSADAPPDPKSKPQAPKPLAENEKDDKPVQNSRYVLDGLNDIGPAAPAAAFAHGVVMITRSDELEIAKLLQPPSKSKKPTPGSIEATARGPQDFWSVARGPALSPTHAYWVSKGRVVRRALAGSDLEVLATDARDGTRVAVVGPPDVVAYITMPVGKQDSLARLRLPDGKKLDLTPEGAAASSVSLARVGEDIVVSYIDGRSGMTPVHARKLHLKSGALDPDVVVWVSGATQGMTEIVSVGHERGSWLLLAVERDASHFGLASLALEQEPKMDPPLRWRTYENGLDRSPAAAATLCGAPTAVYVRPADARPTANQELMLSQLTLDETASSELLATARGFADVSLCPTPEGAMLAYVADRRTWARLIRCKPAP